MNFNPIEAIQKLNREVCYIMNWLKKKPIEVIVGTEEADKAGITAGNKTIQSPSFVGRYVEVYRNDIRVHGFDYMDGNTFLNKALNSDTIFLNDALTLLESIYVKIL